MKKTVLFFICLGFINQFKAQNTDFKKSQVLFSVSNMGINTVKGTIKGFTGEINFNPDDVLQSSCNICVEAKTINTDNEKRDAHLLKEDFFNVAVFPKICFQSNSFALVGKQYIVKGKLTLHGISKMVQIPLSIKNNMLIGKFQLDRLDYEIGTETNKFMVGNTIDITVECQLNELRQ